MYKVGIITASDKGSQGKREDVSGQTIKEIIEKYNYKVTQYIVVPDEKEEIKKAIIDMIDNKSVDLVLTTGGTGFSKRDVTPEATKEVIDKETPGISEGIRNFSFLITPKAMLSRATSGIRKNSLIINMPGSPKAVRESLEYLLKALTHGMDILKGNDSECAED